MGVSSAKKFVLLAAGGLAVLLAILLLATQKVENYLERVLDGEVKSRLEAQLKTTRQAIEIWAEEQRSMVHLWSHEKETLEAMTSLLELAENGDPSVEKLLDHPATRVLRDHLRPVAENQGYIGFVLTHRDGLNVSALLDEPVGKKHFDMKTGFAADALAGKTVLSPPFAASILLPDEKGVWEPDRPTMFASSPVHHPGKGTMGILSFRIRPERNFTSLLGVGNFGKTGEAYAVSREGLMLSPSRFKQQLKNIGMISDTSMLNIRIKDPGGDLTRGYQPKKTRQELPLTKMAGELAKGRSGIDVKGYRDYRGVPVVGAWEWLDEYGFGITVEMDVQEARLPHKAVNRLITGLSALLALLAVLGYLLIVQAIRIRKSEKRYRAQVETTEDVILVADFSNGEILYFNEQAKNFFPASAPGPENIYSIFRASDRQFIRSKTDECGKTGTTSILHQEINLKGTDDMIVDITMNRISLDGKEFLQLTLRNPQARLRLENLQEMAGEVSHLLLDEPDEEQLLNRACSIVKDKGRFRFVWIGFRTPEKPEIMPVAYCGDEQGFFRSLSIGEGRTIKCPADDCMQHNTTVLTSDTSNFNEMAKWREEAFRRGFRSAVSIPINIGGVGIGCFNIFSEKVDDFTPNELRYLERMAFNLSQGLQRINGQKEKRRLEKELQSLAKFPGENPNPVMRFSSEGRVIFSNKAGIKILEQWHTHIGGELPEGWRSLISQASSKDVMLSFEEEFPDRVFLVACQPFPENGYTNAYFTDITDRHRAERELSRAKEEAEKNTRLKDRFVSLVSHDLKGPLSNINGYLSLLKDEKSVNGNKDAVNYLNRAEENIHHMNKVIKDILDLSRFTIGGRKIRKVLFHPRETVKEVFLSVENAALKKELELKNGVAADSRLFADPGLFMEVLHNMVSNAVKFSRKGGTVTVASGAKDGFAVFRIEDEGVGIPPEKLGRLFNYDSRTSTPGTSGEMGTGFGLPLCKEIIDSHSGTIEASSVPEKGTTFTIRIPDIKPVVFLVDDDELTRMTFSAQLADMGCNVFPAANGKEALKLIGHQTPHLVITDLNMPEMGGIELMDEIKKRGRTSGVPMILMTSAKLDDETVQKIQKADEFLTKPISPQDFRLRVGRFIY